MSATSGPVSNGGAPQKTALAGLARDVEFGCRWRAEQQRETARRLDWGNRTTGLGTAVMSAAAGSVLLANSSKVAATVLAFVVAVLSAGLTHLQLGALAAANKKAADQLSNLATRIQLFREVDVAGTESLNHLEQRMSRFLETRDSIVEGAPIPSNRAMAAVSKKRDRGSDKAGVSGVSDRDAGRP